MARWDLEHDPDREPFEPSSILKTPQRALQRQRRASLLRKPVPEDQPVPMSRPHDSYLSMDTDMTIQSQKDEATEVTVNTIEVQEKPKRGWQFYGTFACLAILNLICAIDATILSVALPVRKLIYLILCPLTRSRQ